MAASDRLSHVADASRTSGLSAGPSFARRPLARQGFFGGLFDERC